ncbi:MAG: hypothetical protein CVU05_03650 [Bacteroidetes bacterium HGW-Bacteroidetes-21]|jgi:hypothetical protein|nr:MAG: hypothetical protein CVU05_03650 [Bacteroidetes bacterium HGW-Bacteroidetes-21]
MKVKAILFVSMVLFLMSCNKYPDGPSLSLRSKTDRLSNAWKIDRYYENGEDKTSDANNLLNSYLLSIEKTGSYSLRYKVFGLIAVNESGTWTFDENKEGVIFTRTSPAPVVTSEWTLLRLKEKELWAQYNDSSKVVKVQLIPY